MMNTMNYQSPNSELLDLFISCRNLANKDVMSKSDPYVRVFMSTNKMQPSLVGETETISNDLNPDFKKPVTVNYVYEQHQEVSFKVLDRDDGYNDDLLGDVSIPLPKILMSNPQTGYKQELKSASGKSQGWIQIRFAKMKAAKGLYNFKVRGSKIKDIEFFSKSDPFIRIYRPSQNYENVPEFHTIPSNCWIQVYESEPHMNNLNPVFQPFSISSAQLNCNVDTMANKWEVWDYESDGMHRVISTGYSTGNALKAGQKVITTYDKKGKYGGDLLIESATYQQQVSVVDYLRVGLKFSLVVGIDFTGSNGVQRFPNSLHYFPPGATNYSSISNQYMQTILQVGNILIEYDDDKIVPAYGYGAKIDKGSQTNHCFPLTLDPGNPFCNGHLGVLDAYSRIMNRLEFSGPTNFAPIIRETIKAVSAGYQDNPMNYTILLIITDGLISDFNETVAEIVKASRLPMSLIIVGVGKEDFSQMDALDCDKGVLRDSYGNVASRDIVQFVPFNQYVNNPIILAQEVLKELPQQVDKFYFMIGKQPQL